MKFYNAYINQYLKLFNKAPLLMIPSYSLAPVFGISISEQRKIYFNHRNTLISLLSNTLIVSNNLHNGFFMNSAKYQYASIDSIDPYALLALEATLKNKPQAVAPFLNGSGFTEGAYRMPDGSARVSTRDDELFALKEGEILKLNGK